MVGFLPFIVLKIVFAVPVVQLLEVDVVVEVGVLLVHPKFVHRLIADLTWKPHAFISTR